MERRGFMAVLLLLRLLLLCMMLAAAFSSITSATQATCILFVCLPTVKARSTWLVFNHDYL
jgi:hypothetical protein